MLPGTCSESGEISGSLCAALRSSRIEFVVPKDMTPVEIALVNVLGRTAMQLIDGRYPAGSHSVAIADDIIPKQRYSAGFYLWVVRIGKEKKAIPYLHLRP